MGLLLGNLTQDFVAFTLEGSGTSTNQAEAAANFRRATARNAALFTYLGQA